MSAESKAMMLDGKRWKHEFKWLQRVEPQNREALREAWEHIRRARLDMFNWQNRHGYYSSQKIR